MLKKATMKSLTNFKIAETKEFKKLIRKPELNSFYTKIKDVIYPQLKSNPFFGPNIKKLKGEFEGLYRYRIGNYRLFYKVDNYKIIVFIITLKRRKDLY